MNNNPMTQDEVIRYFASHPNYQLSGYYFKDMTYRGETEPTFVAWIQTDLARDSRVLEDFEAIASVMTQECIALVTDSMKALAFSPSYKGAEVHVQPTPIRVHPMIRFVIFCVVVWIISTLLLAYMMDITLGFNEQTIALAWLTMMLSLGGLIISVLNSKL
jgi:hypothetical protein